MPEVDHPTTASLATAFRTPAEFPQPSGPRNDVTRGWIPDQVTLKGTVVFSAQQAINPRHEGASLNDDHDGTIRQWRIRVNALSARLTGGASAASEEPKAMSESAARAC